MTKLVGEISTIANSMPTRALATFTDHLGYIADLIGDTPCNGCIKIITDCADYGSFFDPLHHRAVVNALIMATTRNIKISMLIGGPAQHITQASSDYGHQFRKQRRTKTFRVRFENYLEYLREEAKTETTNAAFKEWLIKRTLEDAERETFMCWLIANHAFRSGTAITSQISSQSLKDMLLNSLKIYKSGGTLGENEGATFQILLLAREKYFEDFLTTNKVNIRRQLDYRPEIFFWLRESSRPEAAFMFARAHRETPGSTMTTVDCNIIQPFISIFNKEFNGEDSCDQALYDQ